MRSPYRLLARSQEFAKGGQKRGSGDGSPPAESRGRALVGVWMWSPQKPETHAEYSTEHSHISSQIGYCSESCYTSKKILATSTHVLSPLGYTTASLSSLYLLTDLLHLLSRITQGNSKPKSFNTLRLFLYWQFYTISWKSDPQQNLGI